MPKINRQTRGPTKTRSSIPMNGWDTTEWMKILFYGKSGTGKTTLASTFPGDEEHPILWLICSGGDKPGELKSIKTSENMKRILPKVIPTPEMMWAEMEDMSQHWTVVLDHATGLQDIVLASLLGVEMLPAQKGWGLASQQTWGQCSAQSKEILRKLLSHEGHVVIIAQERETKAEGDSDILLPTVGAGLTPSLAAWLNTAVDYICQTRIKEREEEVNTTIGVGTKAKQITTTRKVKDKVDYCLRTAPHPVYITKFRIPRGTELPPEITDPSYEKIQALIDAAQ